MCISPGGGRIFNPPLISWVDGTSTPPSGVPGLLTFYIDGVKVWTTSKDVPTVPMHYVLQFESAIGVGAPANTAAGHVQVDWTTMYSRTP